jgi:sulfate permease
MVLTYIAIAIALFFAMNIGASGAAATMGPAYGSGAVRKKTALLIVSAGIFLGAFLGGGEVAKTVGKGIIPPDIITVQIVVIILISATFTLFIANTMGIPLSTSEVTVGAVVGVGVAYQSLFIKNVLVIVSVWLVIPIIAFIMAFLAGKGIAVLQKKFPSIKNSSKWNRRFLFAVVITGFIEAFAAGMNNVANAVGPLIGADVMDEKSGLLLGAFFVALGAILLGGKVLETNGKKITKLSPLEGSTVSGTGGTLVILASLVGIPVPLTQITTTAIVGLGTANEGFHLWQKSIITKIIKVWIVSPVISLVVSFCLIKLLLEPNPYTLSAVASVFVATVFTMSLFRTIQKEKRSVHDQGGGI